jgi:enoyl-CoA hydratase/carnithine racemase
MTMAKVLWKTLRAISKTTYYCCQQNRRLDQALPTIRLRSPFSEFLAIARELQQQLFQSEDAKEGLTAYNEKRKANFAGK